MRLDADAIREIVERSYARMVAERLGDPGMAALRTVLSSVRRIYQYVDPSRYVHPIRVFCPIPQAPIVIDVASARPVSHPSALRSDAKGPITIQVQESGQLLLWRDADGHDPVALSRNAVLYEYHRGAEWILAEGERQKVVKLVGGVSSMFAVPTFETLEEALEGYRIDSAEHCSCKILQGAWYDGNRLFLRSGPEHIMRDSLRQFLAAALRPHAEVRPEQNVDETHPVDIKVSWIHAPRIALLEIKWLGVSRDPVDGHIVNRYSDARARSGAKQLAEYLDMNEPMAPTHTTVGYLVVFDARRKGLKPTRDTISDLDGLYFRDREVQYKPKYDLKRKDFAPPVRFFVRPKTA